MKLQICEQGIIVLLTSLYSWQQSLQIYRRLMQLTYPLLLQSALQPLWVLACSTIVEYSQQEGFYRVLLPAARLTPNLEDQ